jgi:hypothetical protein
VLQGYAGEEAASQVRLRVSVVVVVVVVVVVSVAPTECTVCNRSCDGKDKLCGDGVSLCFGDSGW